MNSLLEVLKERTPDKRKKSQAERGSLLDFLRERNTQLRARAEKERLLSLARKEANV